MCVRLVPVASIQPCQRHSAVLPTSPHQPRPDIILPNPNSSLLHRSQPGSQGSRRVEADLCVKDGENVWVAQPFQMKWLAHQGGPSNMIKRGWKTSVGTSRRRRADLHREPGSLLAFQRIATCLAPPSSDLNTACPKPHQPPPPPSLLLLHILVVVLNCLCWRLNLTQAH